MDLDTIKILGILGAILMIASIFLTSLSWLAGAILILISLYYLAQTYNERGIFDYALYGFILAFVPAFLVLLMFIGWFTVSMPMRMPMHGNWPFTIWGWGFADLWMLVALIVLFILVLSGYFFYKSMDLLSLKSGVGVFRIAGILTLAGAATLIVFFLGALLLLVSWIILAIAFSSLKHPATPSGSAGVQA